MQKRELKQIAFNVSHGGRESRLRYAEEAVPALGQEMIRLQDAAQSYCREYTATWEAWTSRIANGLLRPLAIEQDVRVARLVRGVAWGLTLTELALSVFLAFFFLVNPIFVVLLALTAIFSLKAGLLALWGNEAQPQWTRRRLLRWVLSPSLAVTLLSVAVLLFTRGVMGWLALLLLPFLNAALFTLSLGILGLAAGLFSLGFLLLWSLHAERRFNALEREAVETRRVLQRAQQVCAQLRPRSNGDGHGNGVPLWGPDQVSLGDAARIISIQPGREETDSRREGVHRRRTGGGSFLASMLFLLAIGMSGCNATASSQAANQVAENAPATAQETPGDAMRMEIWLDWSLSADTGPYREAVGAVLAVLPALAERHRIAGLSAFQFGDKGWSAQKIVGLELPLPPNTRKNEPDALYGQIGLEQTAQAEAKYRARLQEKLAPLRTEELLPVGAVEPSCTDIQGVLERIAASDHPQRKLVFLLTDGAENCAHQLRPVTLDQAQTALIIVLLPESQNVRRGSRPDESWRSRRDSLLQSVPEAIVIPHFGDPLMAANTALKSSHNQTGH